MREFWALLSGGAFWELRAIRGSCRTAWLFNRSVPCGFLLRDGGQRG
jgi:hypothetical protein